MIDPLISPAALQSLIAEDPDLLVLDATFLLPALNRDADAEFAEARIPGAVRFDIDAFARSDADLPHMLPDADQAAQMLGALGLRPGRTVVTFDRWMMMGAARAWWTLRRFGHDDVRVLNGGWNAWRTSGGAIENTPASAPQPADAYPVRPNDALITDEAGVSERLRSGMTVLDARPADRFSGEAPEPREGLRSGHMPGAGSLPFSALLTETGEMKPVDDLKPIFGGRTDVAASCGSGVSACVIALAAARCGDWTVSVYDGSWAEWGRADGPPVVTGA